MEQPEPGVYPGTPEDDYRSWSALNQSELKTWASDSKPPSGRFLMLGSCIHAMILTPGECKKKYVKIKDQWRLNESIGKVSATLWRKENPGKEFIRPDEMDQLRLWWDSLKHNVLAWELLTTGEPEVAMVADLCDARVKCLVDRYVSGVHIVDLKTTQAENESEFMSGSFYKYGYHIQAAWYSDILQSLKGGVPAFYFVCVSKRSFEVWTHKVTDAEMEAGRTCYRMLVNLWRRREQ